MRIFLRSLFWAFTVLILLIAGVVWWYIYRPLPQLDGAVTVPGLQRPVTVERDDWGVPHIRAASLEDAAEAQGYVMAQDRLWQMDLLRRVSRGELSEILGPAALRIDKQFRVLGFGRAAERDLALLDPESRAIMEAYARGINRFIEQHGSALPLEFSLLGYKPRPWQATDSLVIVGYMYQTLTNRWEDKIDRAVVTARVGPDRAQDLFFDDTPLDRYVVGDPDAPNDGSSKVNADDPDDQDDMEPDSVLKAGNQASSSSAGPNTRTVAALGDDSFPDLTSALAGSIRGYLQASNREIRDGLGSNNWVVSGDHTLTHKPLLANDTHLELTIPPIWYELHLTAPGWNVKGFTLPGAPLVVIGHNDKIAWGFTNNGADVQDLYIETFNPAAADEYRVNGAWQKAQIFDEMIHVKGQPDEHFDVVLTRHGPIVRRDGDKAYALRWTATEPGGLGSTYSWLGKAQNWSQFRETMKRVWGPGQNAVYADVHGNIGYIMAARVPLRKKGHGELPVPGDTDDYEWTGYIPFGKLPQALNPEDGMIATANARVVGPNYKPFLTDHWEEPYRVARIYDLLEDKHDLRPLDMLKVQTDTYTYPHVFLAEQLISAAKSHPPRDARAQKIIRQLQDWNGIADPDSTGIAFLDATRRAALTMILEPFLGNDTQLYHWRTVSFLQWVLTERPSDWLPPAYTNYDELLSAAADRGIARLVELTNSGRTRDWEWKRFDALDMLHPIGRQGLLKEFLSITGKPQAGTGYSIRAATPHHGPAMRFVANPANWDESIMLIPAGQSGQPGSSHYTDQFSYWYEGQPLFAPFSDAAEARVRKHTLTLQPGS